MSDRIDHGSGGGEVDAVEESFRYLADPAQMLVFSLDAAGACDFVSPSWCEFTGRAFAAECGDAWLDRVHADDLATVRAGLQRALNDGEPIRQLFRYQRADGTYRWFVNQGMPKTGANGRVIGFVGVCLDVTSYQEGDADAERSARQLVALLRETRLIGVVLDRRGHVQYSNAGLCRLLGASGVELMDSPLFERYLAPLQRELLDFLYPGGQQVAGFPAEFESSMQGAGGTMRHVAWHSIVLRDAAGNARNTILIGDDVTELRQTEEQLSLSAKIFDATNHAMLVTTLEGSIVAVNRAFTLLTGYEREEAVGRNPRLLQSGCHDRSFYEQLWRTLLATGHWAGDVWDRRKDGSIYPKYLSISVIRDRQGAPTHYSGIFYDASERKSVEERLDRLAHYDPLTGLPNRSLLMDRLEQSVERANRQGTRVGLLYLDLDHFKQVNDTLGHAAGDALLREMAQRMRSCVRSVDTVARLGGDEFVVLVPDVHSRDELTHVANKIIETLTPPCQIEGQTVLAPASVGISVFPDDGSDVHGLIRHADAAMYLVKQTGRGAFRFYDPASE